MATRIVNTFKRGDSVCVEYAGDDIGHTSFSRDDYCGRRFLTNIKHITAYDNNIVYWKFDSVDSRTNDLSVKSCKMVITEKANPLWKK